MTYSRKQPHVSPVSIVSTETGLHKGFRRENLNTAKFCGLPPLTPPIGKTTCSKETAAAKAES